MEKKRNNSAELRILLTFLVIVNTVIKRAIKIRRNAKKWRKLFILILYFIKKKKKELYNIITFCGNIFLEELFVVTINLNFRLL